MEYSDIPLSSDELDALSNVFVQFSPAEHTKWVLAGCPSDHVYTDLKAIQRILEKNCHVDGKPEQMNSVD